MQNVKQTLRARISSIEHMLSIVNILGYAAVVGNPYRNPNIAEHDRTEKSGLVSTQNVEYFRTKNENRKSGDDSPSGITISHKRTHQTSSEHHF